MEQDDPAPLVPYLLLDPEEDKGVDYEFLGEAVRKFDEDSLLKPMFINSVERLSHELAAMSLNDDYKPYVLVRFVTL